MADATVFVLQAVDFRFQLFLRKIGDQIGPICRYVPMVSQFGMMFFQDQPKAVSEMYRVTKPGAELAVAVWHSFYGNPAYKDIVSVREPNVSPDAANTVRMPFCLDNPL
ncbi:hypothetical protein ACEWL3_018515 [Sulfitobacter sp. MF3-043]